jgi:hypothetical protein
MDRFLGARPQTPWVRFAEFWEEEIGSLISLAELTLLLLFWKRRKPLNVEFCWGHAPRPPWVRFAEFWEEEIGGLISLAELTLLLLFWKRRKPLNVEFCWGHAPRPPPGCASRSFGKRKLVA